MTFGIWQLVIIVLIIFVVFGAGKLPRVMGDIGEGIKNLRKGLKSDEIEQQKKQPTMDKAEQAKDVTKEEK